MPGSTPRRVIPRDSTSKEGSQPNKHLMHKETQYPEAEYPQGQYNTPNPGSQEEPGAKAYNLQPTLCTLHVNFADGVVQSWQKERMSCEKDEVLWDRIILLWLWKTAQSRTKSCDWNFEGHHGQKSNFSPIKDYLNTHTTAQANNLNEVYVATYMTLLLNSPPLSCHM